MSNAEDTAERPKLFSQLRAKSIAAGSSFIGQIKATTSKLNPLGQGSAEQEQSEKIDYEEEPEEDLAEQGDPNLSTVRLSDDEAEKGTKAKPGFLGQLKQSSENAGAAFVGGIKTTSESAGAAIVGGFKATTNLLTPLVGGTVDKTPKDERNDEQINEEFSHIEIDEEPEPNKPKLTMLEQLKLKTGISKAKEEDTYPHTSHHHETNSSAHQTEAPKEGFLHQMKAKVGLVKEDDGISHNSAPKEGLFTKVNPFASSTPSHKEPAAPAPAAGTKAPSRFHHDDRRASATGTSSSSTGGITSVFESITGKTSSPPKKRPEPTKQASFFDTITGKPAAPAKEPSFFDKMTGNTPAANKSTDTGWF